MKIKICGITNLDDALHAAGCGADLLGFVFYPNSPRCIAPGAAAEIIAGLPEAVDKVGVFVNESIERMLTLGRDCGLTALQLHGAEPPEQLRELVGFKLIKAVTLTTEADFERLEDYSGATLLVDTPSAAWGGSGQTGDWELAGRAAGRHRIFLAGGLTPENVAAAIQRVGPAGVDVSSGVERVKGVKDHARVKALILAARQAEQAL